MRVKLLNLTTTKLTTKIMAVPNYMLHTQQHYTDAQEVHVVDRNENDETIACSPMEISKSASMWAARSTRFSPEWR